MRLPRIRRGGKANLLERVKVVLHAFDGNILAILDALRFEHLGECTLAFLSDQPVF